MPIYEIRNFDDLRFVSYIMREEKLEELTKDLLFSLSFWADEIREHKFANKGLEYIAGIMIYFLIFDHRKKTKSERLETGFY